MVHIQEGMWSGILPWRVLTTLTGNGQPVIGPNPSVSSAPSESAYQNGGDLVSTRPSESEAGLAAFGRSVFGLNLCYQASLMTFLENLPTPFCYAL